MARRYWDDGWDPVDDEVAHDYDPEPDWEVPTPQELAEDEREMREWERRAA